MKKNFDQHNTLVILFEKTKTNESSLTASYEKAQIIAKTGNEHTVAENVIKPSFEILVKTMLQQDSVNVLKALPLSNDSIRRRIDEMSLDVESRLVEKLKTSIVMQEASDALNKLQTVTLFRPIRSLQCSW